jgi:hypothetical protein
MLIESVMITLYDNFEIKKKKKFYNLFHEVFWLKKVFRKNFTEDPKRLPVLKYPS